MCHRAINSRAVPHARAALMKAMQPTHVYEVSPRKDHRGLDLISDSLPFGRLWYGEPDALSNAVDYAKFRSRSHKAVIRVYDESGQRDRNARTRGRFQDVVVFLLAR